MWLVKAAIGDAVVTFMWIICASTIGAITSIIANMIGVQGMASLAITTSLIFVISVLFGLIADAFGGASFNATGAIDFYIADAGGDDDTLMSTVIRFPAQAVGAVGGVLALMELMPLEYKHMLEGPTPKVDLHTGAIAEGVLTFAITFVVLLIIIKGPKSLFWKNWMLSGSDRSWFKLHGSFNESCQWAILAAWFYRLVFPPPPASKPKTA
ncbi:hypothetical protein L1987_33631 [Smallanthus sonchifolius]|uniref:Uncharacterized protein n=1 Tax=Smallanthus sonchifolius TaxID=185202 RepID=A0ACB9HSD8_9ASTR|nr:hypothetical protein L1987_33631 [Smallanthus sonchifolius]